MHARPRLGSLRTGLGCHQWPQAWRPHLCMHQWMNQPPSAHRPSVMQSITRAFLAVACLQSWACVCVREGSPACVLGVLDNELVVSGLLRVQQAFRAARVCCQYAPPWPHQRCARLAVHFAPRQMGVACGVRIVAYLPIPGGKGGMLAHSCARQRCYIPCRVRRRPCQDWCLRWLVARALCTLAHSYSAELACGVGGARALRHICCLAAFPFQNLDSRVGAHVTALMPQLRGLQVVCRGVHLLCRTEQHQNKHAVPLFGLCICLRCCISAV